MKRYLKNMMLFALTIILICVFASCNRPPEETNTGSAGEAGEAKDQTQQNNVDVEKNYTFVLNEDGQTYTLEKYLGDERDIRVPQSFNGKDIVTIGKNAFLNVECDTIILPETITAIEDRAFLSSDVKSITLSNSIQKIASLAFYDCKYLENITLPNSLLKIESQTFKECDSLKAVTVGDGTREIAYDAFDRCPSSLVVAVSQGNTALSSYTSCIVNVTTKTVIWGKAGAVIPSDAELVTSIGKEAFRASSLYSIAIPSNVSTVGEYAFADNTTLTSVEFDKASGVTELKNGTFYGCANLKEISFPDGLQTISDSALEDCEKISTLALPKAFVNIDREMFDDCNDISSLSISDENAKYRSESNCIIERDTNTIVMGCKSSEIPTEGNIRIAKKAFYECKGLQSMIIPSNVIEIGEYAFACSELTELTISAGIKVISDGAFLKCYTLNTITFSEGTEVIGNKAFYLCRGILELNLPSSLRNIGKDAFYGCDNITKLRIPEGTRIIGESAFASCVSLEDIYVPKTVETICRSAFQGCIRLWSVSISEGVKNIENEAFRACVALKNVSVPSTIEQFGADVFAESPAVMFSVYENAKYVGSDEDPYNVLIEANGYSVNMHPDTVFIADGAFLAGNTVEMTLATNIVILKNGMLSECTMNMINIHPYLLLIEKDAFYGCGNLSIINFDGNTYEWMNMTKEYGWDSYIGKLRGKYTVCCNDGKIEVDVANTLTE